MIYTPSNYPQNVTAFTVESKPTQEIARRTIDICLVIERRQYGFDGDNRCNHVDKLPPFVSRPPKRDRPCIGARLL